MVDSLDTVSEQHGGNISAIIQRFPAATRPIIDLSTGINPYPYPLQFNEKLNYRLPDIVEMKLALAAASSYYRTNVENVTIASGMQQLMFAFASYRLQNFGNSKIAILSPTYSEYEKIWKHAGHNITNVQSTHELLQSDVAIICNPNNPDGRILTSEILLQLSDRLAQKNGWLIIDESFVDTMPELSLVSHITKQNNLIIMRSCGKFFGIAGARVSAVIASANITNWLRIVVSDWPITTAICAQLPTMFADNNWIENTREKLESESTTWRKLLEKYFTIVGYTSLFTLVKTDDTDGWHEHLAAQGILIRKFSYNDSWLRFGLPHSPYLERINKMFMAKK